ncbi:bifunctional diaminohydroxyphosphoribosylaminopyrimidine deaminase/5-amino-6-(5-phosphoribosylamino)uracil reductase RibD [Streptomyces sp. 4N509B]|uniref:bifunctional diaminohydroxyphosphoribosylaminopyrimidine deaminase/5-amino-6-(5-phosphoribosylamino)uracil reductase RibD n=1 Tax=Streptomyces sp. 4N509B TaxID=3457413 RepID=UPI003FD0660F
MANAQEVAAMRRAIAISAHGLGATSPNPPVGCVILDSEGRTVGEGYHLRKGDAHAEANALAAAGKLAEGSTAVVTLEPCNHQGRTPPCRQALIDASVARVLIAVMDPTSRGEGGAALLHRAGVDVERDVLREEALLVLGPWLKSLSESRPYITWAYEAGADGTPIPHDHHGAVTHDVRRLHDSHDLLIRQNGDLREGRSGAHGPDVFTVPRGPLTGEVADVLTTLSGSGARSVLLEGAPGSAATAALAALADQLITYIPSTPRSWSPVSGQATAIPDGYRLADVTRLGGYVRLSCHRS